MISGIFTLYVSIPEFSNLLLAFFVLVKKVTVQRLSEREREGRRKEEGGGCVRVVTAYPRNRRWNLSDSRERVRRGVGYC